MPPTKVVGRTAAELRDRSRDAGQLETDELAALADRIASSLPLGGPEKEVLARVLGAPPPLALRWVQDTIGLLRTPPTDAKAVVARLDVLAWAWGDIPASWDPPSEQQLLRAWTVELERAGA